MQLPEHIVVRRKHKITGDRLEEYQQYINIIKSSEERMISLRRSLVHAQEIITGKIEEDKMKLGWHDADATVFNPDENELWDLSTEKAEDGTCKNCGVVHD